MAWINESGTLAGSYTYRTANSYNGVTRFMPFFPQVIHIVGTEIKRNNLDESFADTGFIGYAPAVERPISGSFKTIGGGSARPSSGFLYPRGDG